MKSCVEKVATLGGNMSEPGDTISVRVKFNDFDVTKIRPAPILLGKFWNITIFGITTIA